LEEDDGGTEPRGQQKEGWIRGGFDKEKFLALVKKRRTRTGRHEGGTNNEGEAKKQQQRGRGGKIAILDSIQIIGGKIWQNPEVGGEKTIKIFDLESSVEEAKIVCCFRGKGRQRPTKSKKQ